MRMGWWRFFSISASFTAFSSYCMFVIQNRSPSPGPQPFSSGSKPLLSTGIGFWAPGFPTLSTRAQLYFSISVAVDLWLGPRCEKVCSSFIQELKTCFLWKKDLGNWKGFFHACLLAGADHLHVSTTKSLSRFPIFLVSTQWSLC